MHFARTDRKMRELSDHFESLKKSRNVDEFETNFAAFLSSGRSVTFALQRDAGIVIKDGVIIEKSGVAGFAEWYSEKQNEMHSDELCKYFKDTRDLDLHTGNTVVRSNYHLSATVSTPPRASIQIGTRGTYLVYNEGTPEERRVQMSPGRETFEIGLESPPASHKGAQIADRSPIALCKLFKNYLEKLLLEAKMQFLKSD